MEEKEEDSESEGTHGMRLKEKEEDSESEGTHEMRLEEKEGSGGPVTGRWRGVGARGGSDRGPPSAWRLRGRGGAALREDRAGGIIYFGCGVDMCS